MEILDWLLGKKSKNSEVKDVGKNLTIIGFLDSAMQRRILIIGLVLLLVVSSGCINDVNNDVNKDVNKEPELRVRSGMLIASYEYLKGVLIGVTLFEYFEVTGGSGEVHITVSLEREGDKQDRTNTFFVEEGKSYRLSIWVSLRKDQMPIRPEDRYDLIISSPSIINSPVSRERAITGHFGWVSLGEMKLTPVQPTWAINIYIIGDEGSVGDPFSLSASVGTLIRARSEGHAAYFYATNYRDGTEVTLTATPG